VALGVAAARAGEEASTARAVDAALAMDSSKVSAGPNRRIGDSPYLGRRS
jgi:hypothetical protein